MLELGIDEVHEDGFFLNLQGLNPILYTLLLQLSGKATGFERVYREWGPGSYPVIKPTGMTTIAMWKLRTRHLKARGFISPAPMSTTAWKDIVCRRT